MHPVRGERFRKKLSALRQYFQQLYLGFIGSDVVLDEKLFRLHY